MISTDLATYKDNQPIAAGFLTAALTHRRLAHAYLFKGQDIGVMYSVALTLATVLNCEKSSDFIEACGICANCRWISENAHPAVMTITPLTYLTEKAAGTQIKADQTSELISHLNLSSPYVRLVIFADAEAVPATGKESFPSPKEWSGRLENENKHLRLKPLNQSILNMTSANRLLKTLEEPFANTLFIFLTDHEDNLIETIVSRCQILPFHPMPAQPCDLIPLDHQAFLTEFLTQTQSIRDPYLLSTSFRNFLEQEKRLTPVQLIREWQLLLQAQFHEKSFSREGFQRYVSRQQQLEQACRYLEDSVNTEQTLNRLFYQWVSKK